MNSYTGGAWWPGSNWGRLGLLGGGAEDDWPVGPVPDWGGGADWEQDNCGEGADIGWA